MSPRVSSVIRTQRVGPSSNDIHVFRIYAHPRIQVHVHRVRDMAYADCFSKCNRIWTEIERLNMYETAHEYNSAEQT